MRKLLLIPLLLGFVFIGAGMMLHNASAGHNAEGLAGYWPMDDGADPTEDLAHGNDGDVDGAVYNGSGAFPLSTDSLNFDGIDDVVTVADSAELDISEELTISFWFRLDGASSDNAFPRPVTKGQTTVTDGAYGVFVRDTSGPTDIGLRFVDTLGTTHDVRDQSLPNYDDGEWHHVVVTYSDSNDEGKLYFDGIDEVTVPIAGDVDIRDTVDALTIGAGVGDADRHWNGGVDEVRIYDRAVSANEVSALNDYSNFTLDSEAVTPDFNPVGEEHTVSVTVDPALAGIPVLFEIDGSNSAESATVLTDGAGVATLDYTSDGTAGLDVISACVDEESDGCDDDDEALEFEKYWLNGMVDGGGHILEEVGNKRKDWLDVSFGGLVGDAGSEGLVGEWQINFHNIDDDEIPDKSVFHTTDFSALNFFSGDSDTCDSAVNFTATGELNHESGYTLVMRGGDSGNPASTPFPDDDTVRIEIKNPGGVTIYDTTVDGFSNESSCVGGSRTGLDTGNLTIILPL